MSSIHPEIDSEEIKVIHAVTGILRNDKGEIFVQQRRPTQVFPCFWEFPGGKIDPGENALDALCREMWEEVGVNIFSADVFKIKRFDDYLNTSLELTFFNVTSYDGSPTGCEGQNFRWSLPSKFPYPVLKTNSSVCDDLKREERQQGSGGLIKEI